MMSKSERKVGLYGFNSLPAFSERLRCFFQMVLSRLQVPVGQREKAGFHLPQPQFKTRAGGLDQFAGQQRVQWRRAGFRL